MPIDLGELASSIGGSITHLGDRPVRVSGVSHNSEWISAGDVFVAIPGHVRDGHRYVPDALARGAVAVAGEGFAGQSDLPVPYLRVSRARTALADIATAVYGYPSAKLKVIGVTGTKGKTTTTWLVRHLLRVAGHKVGLLSTLGYKLDDEELHQFPAHFTTPEAPQVQATLAWMVRRGCTHVVVEASSEALAQHRLRGTHIDVAIWTNLAPEHLNFHGDMEGYFAAKRILIDAAGFAVLNAADPWAMRLTDRPHATYSGDQAIAADWSARSLVEADDGLRFDVLSPVGVVRAGLPVIGVYNVANTLGAMAAVHRLGTSLPDIVKGLACFAGVPGRMQIVQEGPVRVILDFAHTPESLHNALSSLRATTRRALTVVLGSAGGPRDPSKRAPLGAVATDLADVAVFTEEDCRDTPIFDILNEMKRGADEQGSANYVLIPDRVEATDWALRQARPGDTVVFCGKAGETTLERAHETIPWDEETIVRQALARLDGTALD